MSSKKIDVNVSVWTKATIDSWNLGSAIEREIDEVLGGTDRLIRAGIVYEEDYRFNRRFEAVRNAKEGEEELVNALLLVAKHFKQMK